MKQIKASDFTDERFGLPTILDILSELEKPGRDPRGEFQTASFAEGIHEISDLQVGMIREVVKAGDVVKVKVLEVDTERKRIALTMRLNDDAGAEKRAYRTKWRLKTTTSLMLQGFKRSQRF